MIKKKWTQEKVEELKRLRYEEKLTLTEIGIRYKISKERVRQLIGNTRDLRLRHRTKLYRTDMYLNNEKYRNEVLKLRFMRKIKIDVETGCWNWDGTINVISGYGYFYLNKNKLISTRRYSHYLKYGEYPKNGTQLRYKCGNHICCNPEHER